MITNKPWGYEELLSVNDKYAHKLLFMKAGHKCSLQFHQKKVEDFYVISGKMLFTYGDSQDSLQQIELGPGGRFIIPAGMIHRMEAIEDILYIEASTPELDDVTRLEDSYGRTS